VTGLGYIPDPPKATDWPFKATFLGAAPVAASLSAHIVSVLNQGSLGSCVAQAGFQAIRMRQLLQGAAAPPLGSRLFGYWFARAVNHMTKVDSGTHIRSFFEVLNTFGFPAEAFWPYVDADTGADTDPFRMRPPTAAIHAAYDFRSPTVYRRVAAGRDAPNAVRRAIAAGFPVVFGCDVGRDFVKGNVEDWGHPIYPPLMDDVMGGHAMTIVGYDDSKGVRGGFDVLNSWGRKWGLDGRCWFSADYVAEARDIWVVERAPMPGEV
jgi:C1A family cysteine protease